MSEIEENKESTLSTTVDTKPITKKDPKRVAQGKKLATISKEAKERKMRAKIEAEMLQDKESSKSIPYLNIILPCAGGVSILFFLGWYFSGGKKEDLPVEPVHFPSKEESNKKFEEL